MSKASVVVPSQPVQTKLSLARLAEQFDVPSTLGRKSRASCSAKRAPLATGYCRTLAVRYAMRRRAHNAKSLVPTVVIFIRPPSSRST